MPVLYSNFQTGTITDNPLSNVATTVTSSGFSSLPTITSPDYMWITLDPLGTAGSPEIVKVTAHSSSATTITVTRGQQGTSARQHNSGVIWANSATKSDFEQMTTVPTGFRNAIINGDFSVWQRGAGAFTTGFSSDRWGSSTAGTTHSITRQSFTLGNEIAGQESPYYLRNVVTSSAGAGNFSLIYQAIEGVRSFAGQTVTVSYWAKADATKKLATEFRQVFGTGGTPTSTVFDIGVNQVTLSTAWQKFSYQVSIPSISGSTIGTNGDDYLRLTFWFDAGSTFNSRTNSMGQQSGTFDVWGVQVELGSTDTTFERIPYVDQLARCQRYYCRINQTTATATPFGAGLATATTTAAVVVALPVTMRAAPSGTLDTTGTAGNYTMWTSGGGGQACNAVPTLNAASPNAAQVNCSVASGLTAGNATALLGTASANAYLGFSAEL